MPKKIYPFKIGNKYLLRTVSYFAVGEIYAIQGDFLVLCNASWVADTGRFSEAIANGTLSEVEYLGKAAGGAIRVYVNMGAIVDAFDWAHDLPAKTV
jgi:hypothetical protein